MYRDVTNIPTDKSCYYIIDDKTIGVDDNNIQDQYAYLSNTYIRKNSVSNEPRPENSYCHTYADIQRLPSTYDFIMPIYHTIAIASALMLFYFAYKLIIYPWFRKNV